MSTPVADVITRYFAADKRRDVDAIVALFTDDAVVIDEGQTRRGVTEIRSWQEGPASQYQYTIEVLGVQAAGDGNYVARTHLEGNFPGGTVDLKYRFTVDGDRISRLAIAP